MRFLIAFGAGIAASLIGVVIGLGLTYLLDWVWYRRRFRTRQKLYYCGLTCIGGSEERLCPCKGPRDCELRLAIRSGIRDGVKDWLQGKNPGDRRSM